MRSGQFFLHRFQLFDRLLLAGLNHADAVGLLGIELRLRRTGELPRRGDDLLLQIDGFVHRVGTLLFTAGRLRLAARRRFDLPEDFLERANLGEVHVAAGPTRLTIRITKVRPA